MNEFKQYHPLVNFIYFIAVIGFSMFFMHPAYLAISFFASFFCAVLLKGFKRTAKSLIFILPLVLVTALINPLFNHDGTTVLAYFPNGNLLTLESVLYGVMAACILVTVIEWFSAYNEIMTSDKFIYLFGKAMPSLSLVLSMTLRFIPRFKTQLKEVMLAQKSIGKDVTKGSLIERTKIGLSVLSVMVTWSLENSIETADSMKSRGYGLPNRSAFSVFVFDSRDKRTLCFIGVLVIFLLFAAFFGAMHATYFPSMQLAKLSGLTVSAVLAYSLLCFLPIVTALWEVKTWKL